MNNRCFNCQVKDKIVRSLSASGGMSALLASAVIEQKGIVYGAAYSNDFRRVDIDWVDNMHDYYARISKSKYVYSFMPKFDEIRQKVETGRKVLIGALPCQIVALAKFLGKKYPNLYMAALKCHGSTNPKIYSCFIDRIEEENKSKLISFDFRKNHKFAPTARFANGKTIVYDIDLFMNNNCEHCPSCKVKWDNEYADFIIGDYWEYQKNRETLFDQSLTVNDGISFLKVKTENGMKLFEQVKEQLNYKEFDGSRIKYTEAIKMKKAILFTWFGDEKPPYIQWTLENFRKMNPGWEIRYIEYSTQQIMDFKQQDDPILVQAIKQGNYRHINGIADNYRKAYLTEHTDELVVYCDLDCFPIAPLDNFIVDEGKKIPDWIMKAHMPSHLKYPKMLGMFGLNCHSQVYGVKHDIWCLCNNKAICSDMFIQIHKGSTVDDNFIPHQGMLMNAKNIPDYINRNKDFHEMKIELGDSFCLPHFTPIEHYYSFERNKLNLNTGVMSPVN